MAWYAMPPRCVGKEEQADGFIYRPGQFVEVSVFGVGEAPFGLSYTQTRPGSIMVTVRAVGTVTRALHALGPGDMVGVRGSLGNDFLSVLNGSQSSPPYPASEGRAGDGTVQGG